MPIDARNPLDHNSRVCSSSKNVSKRSPKTVSTLEHLIDCFVLPASELSAALFGGKTGRGPTLTFWSAFSASALALHGLGKPVAFAGEDHNVRMVD
jgi:hypothetical protein